MILRQSAFAHAIPLAPGRAMILHALTHARLAVDGEAAALLAAFATPRRLPEDAEALARDFGHSVPVLAGAVAALYERGFLTERTAEEEAAVLLQGSGRDPGEALDAVRRARREGAEDYWASSATRGLADLGAPRKRIEVALFGDCDLHREAEFLRLEGAARGFDLRIGATFADDVDWAAERRPDVMILGALRSRGTIAATAPGEDSSREYISEARRRLTALRSRSPATILVDNLPEPSVEPLGLAERGPGGHRNRYRRVNLALSELVEEFADVHVVDVAAALGQAGSAAWLDDGLTSFTHFGSPGWMLVRPEAEKAAVHGLFPDIAPLAEAVGGDPHGRERIVARAHLDTIVATLGIDAKKAVVVDLDGVLWPGVLAETGAPFAWSPEVSGLSSFIGLYVGLHEALKTLKRRGILLAAASRNDEGLLRSLWRYPENHPRERLLTPEDFTTMRINWRDKPGNLREIAAELGVALETLVFIDDHPHERERVKRELPEVEVWGEDPFALRRRLLGDPRLQRPRLTAEAAERGALVEARIARDRLRTETDGEAAFLDSLQIACRIERLGPGAPVGRVQELFQRTTQFNTTGRAFGEAELAAMCLSGDVFVMHVSDKFADHGLVGAAIVEHGEIIGFAMSCRVIGLGVEQRLLAAIVEGAARRGGEIVGRIVETPRNGPARNLYAHGGFTPRADGVWTRRVDDPKAAA